MKTLTQYLASVCYMQWQGMLNANGDVVKDAKTLMSLWKHECYRVIADRFTTQDDKNWFEKTIKQVNTGWFHFLWLISGD